jgi:putative spermidine/putrescine transport system permease protein
MSSTAVRKDRTPLNEAVGHWRWPTYFVGGLLACYLILPIALMVPSSLTSGEFLVAIPDSFSLRWYSEVFHDPTWRSAFILSFKIASVDAALATVLGTAAALAVARSQRGKRLLRAAFLAPLILPEIVFALGIYNLIYGLNLTPSTWFVVPGQTCLAIPLVFVAVSAGIAGIDPTLTRAAESLGASWRFTLLHIELPLLARHIAAAATFALAFCFDDVVIALFLATPGSSTLPVQIYTTARSEVSPAIAAAGVVVMMIALALLGLVTLILRTRRQSDGVTVTQ